jgi:hypothetical protein
MPIYLFENPEDENDIREVIMSVHDKHELIVDGVKWGRVWTNPLMSVDAKLNPNDPQSFVKYTNSRKGSYGELLDLSKELTQQRKDKNAGYDPVEQEMFANYSKTRAGRQHPEQKKQKLKEQLKSTPFELDE